MKTENPVPKIERERESKLINFNTSESANQRRRPQNGAFQETNLGIGARAKGGSTVRGKMGNWSFREKNGDENEK